MSPPEAPEDSSHENRACDVSGDPITSATTDAEEIIMILATGVDSETPQHQQQQDVVVRSDTPISRNSSNGTGRLLVVHQPPEDMPTPVISNRLEALMQMPLPPMELLPPSPPSVRPSNQGGSAVEYLPRSLTLRSERIPVTSDGGGNVGYNRSSLSSSPPRFSSDSEEPIVMSAGVMQDWMSRSTTVTANGNGNVNTILATHRSRSQRRWMRMRTKATKKLSSSSAQVAPMELPSSSSVQTDCQGLAIELLVHVAVRAIPLARNKLRYDLFQSHVRALQLTNPGTSTSPPPQNSHCFIKQPALPPQLPPSSPTLRLPSPSPRTRFRRAETAAPVVVQGIANYGQTCFLNSVLQALASLESFVAYLELMLGEDQHNRVVEQPPQPQQRYFPSRHPSLLYGSNRLDVSPLGAVKEDEEENHKKGHDVRHRAVLCETLLDVLLSINGQKPPPPPPQQSSSWSRHPRVDPRPVLRVVGQSHEQFQSSRYAAGGGGNGGAGTNVTAEQQDAQELLQAVLGVIIDELKGTLEQWSLSSSLRPQQQQPSPLYFGSNQLRCWDADGEDVVTMVSGLRELRLGQREHNKECHHAIPPTTNGMAIHADVDETDTCQSPCGNVVGEDRLHSPKSILLHKNDLDSSTISSGEMFLSSTQREEKKQEEFEVYVPRVASEEDLFLGLQCFPPPFATVGNALLNMGIRKSSSTRSTLSTISMDDASISSSDPIITSVSKAMEIMMTTTSSISPSPLSGWCGSALMCTSCRRVRPIQNALFLDIPIVPTAVSHYLSRPSGIEKPGAREPPCRLEVCLEEFTSIERVRGVECKNCTIQAEIKEQESEKVVLEQIIDGLLSRRAKRGAGMDDALDASRESKHLRDELAAIASRLDELRRISPDDDGPLCAIGSNDSSDDGEVPVHIPLKRSDAFKCLLLTRLPSVLSIHVQRRYYDQVTGRTSKTVQHIIFREILDVAPYCAYGGSGRPDAPFAGTTSNSYNTKAEPIAPIPYKLQSVIEHQGGPYSGHYVCYRRDPSSSERWLWISDDTVKVCSWTTVRNCQAYMLFYEAM